MSENIDVLKVIEGVTRETSDIINITEPMVRDELTEVITKAIQDIVTEDYIIDLINNGKPVQGVLSSTIWYEDLFKDVNWSGLKTAYNVERVYTTLDLRKLNLINPRQGFATIGLGRPAGEVYKIDLLFVLNRVFESLEKRLELLIQPIPYNYYVKLYGDSMVIELRVEEHKDMEGSSKYGLEWEGIDPLKYEPNCNTRIRQDGTYIFGELSLADQSRRYAEYQRQENIAKTCKGVKSILEIIATIVIGFIAILIDMFTIKRAIALIIFVSFVMEHC